MNCQLLANICIIRGLHCYYKKTLRKHQSDSLLRGRKINTHAHANHKIACLWKNVFKRRKKKNRWWKPGSATRKQMWWVCIVEQQPKDQYELRLFTEDRHQTRQQGTWSVWSVSAQLTLGKSFVINVFPFSSLKLKQKCSCSKDPGIRESLYVAPQVN